MLSTVSQINPIHCYKKKINNVSFREKTSSLTNQNDSFEKIKKIQSEKNDFKTETKVSKLDRIISSFAIISFATLLLYVLLKKNKPTSNSSSIDSYQFENLKKDLNIPTLDSCKSLDKDLKILLQKQISLLKANQELLEEVGKPTQANRFLLAGPPGTGKTFFSKIFSKTIDAEYLEVFFSDINSRWAGQGVENIDALFKKIITQAKNNPEKKYVVTFNEIDSLLLPLEQLVGNGGGTHFATLRRQRSTFLTYLDRLATETSNVIIIGTTNMKPKTRNLDAATMSRFPKIIEITYPNKDCLYEAMKKGLSKIKNIDNFISNNDNKMKNLAEIMSNRKFSYRDLETLLNDSKFFYLEEKLNNKDIKFKFEYLDKAFKELKYSDGEREIQSLENLRS